MFKTLGVFVRFVDIFTLACFYSSPTDAQVLPERNNYRIAKKYNLIAFLLKSMNHTIRPHDTSKTWCSVWLLKMLKLKR